MPQGRKAPWVHTAEGDDDMPGTRCQASTLLLLGFPGTNE